MTSGPSAVANLKEQIKIRGLAIRSGFKDTPLNRFKGTLTSWDAYNQPAQQAGWNDRVMVRLQFDEGDLEVIHSDTPYTHPNAAIEIPYSDNAIREDGQGNGWAFFAKSCERIIPEGQGMDALVGHELEIEWRDTIIDEEGNSKPIMVWGGTQANKAVQRQTWILVGADGKEFVPFAGTVTAVGAPSTEGLPDIDTQIISAIDGKDKNDANSALMGIDAVRSSKMAQVMSGKIYTDLVEAGKITVDEGGVYHKV